MKKLLHILLSCILLVYHLQACANVSLCQAMPYQIVDGVAILTATIEGRPYQLLLDTGGDMGLVLKDKILAQLKTLKDTGKTIRRGGAAGKVHTLKEFTLPELKFGKSSYHNISTVEMHEWGIGHHDAHLKVDGFIGLSAMAEHDFTLHPQKHLLYIGSPASCSISSAKWKTIPLILDDFGVHIHATIKGEEKHFLLDSAATVSFIDPSSLPKTLKPVKCKSSNSQECLYLKNNEVNIAGQILRRLHVVKIPYLKEEGIDGILGADFLNKLIIYHGFSTRQLGIALP